MALTPFFTGLTGDPAALHRAIRSQPTRGLPVTEVGGTFRDFLSFGGAIPLTREVIDRQAFSTAGEEKTPLRGKMQLPATVTRLGDLDPSDYGLLHFVTNVIGKYSVANTPNSASVKRWHIDKLQATTADRYLSILEHDDINPAKRLHDVRAGGLTIGASPNGNLSVGVNYAAGGYTMGGIVDQEVGAASTLPVIRKTWPGNFALDAIAGDIWIKILTDLTGGQWAVQVGVSSSGAAPVFADTRTMTEGQWFDLFDIDGSRIGVKAEQPQAFWPVGATLVVLDQFRVPKRRVNWTESLGTNHAISSVSASLLLNLTDQIPVEGGWEISIAQATFENVPDVFGQQGHTVRKRGALQTRLTLTREIEDLTVQKALHEAEVVSAVIDAETEVKVGATIYPFRFVALLPRLIIQGPMYAVNEGATEAQENPTFRAGEPDATFTYTAESGDIETDAAVAIILESDIAAL